MEKLSDRIRQKIILKKAQSVKIKHQYQDIALQLAETFGAKGKERMMLFGFVKRVLAKGGWGKIKEVREYMESKGIKSVRYFMASFKKKK